MLNNLAVNLATPARWLIVAGIAYTLATSVLYFVSGPASAPGVGGERPASTPRVTADVNSVLSRNLFGSTVAGEAEPVVSSAPAVATQLPLELRGVFVADQGASVAIIAERGRSGNLFTIGDTLPGNATLLDVLADHVVLSRAGIRETLHFPRPGATDGRLAPSPPPQAYDDPPEFMAYPEDYGSMDTSDYYQDTAEVGMIEDGAGMSSTDEIVSEYRDRLEEDPAQTIESLGMSPVSEGEAQGYRVGDLAQSPYLSQTGLQPGDVILSINGRPVGDLSQDRLEIDNVLADGSARIEVQRGTRRFFITASLQP